MKSLKVGGLRTFISKSCLALAAVVPVGPKVRSPPTFKLFMQVELPAGGVAAKKPGGTSEAEPHPIFRLPPDCRRCAEARSRGGVTPCSLRARSRADGLLAGLKAARSDFMRSMGDLYM